MHFLTGAPLEATLALIKPDAVQDGKAGALIAEMESGPFFVADVFCTTWPTSFAEEFYRDHKGRAFFPALVKFMTSGRLYMITLVGPDAVYAWREAIGNTDPEKAQAHTLRRLYSRMDGVLMHNAVHGSDGTVTASWEINLIASELKTKHHLRDGSVQCPQFGEEAHNLIEKYEGRKWDNEQRRLVQK